MTYSTLRRCKKHRYNVQFVPDYILSFEPGPRTCDACFLMAMPVSNKKQDMLLQELVDFSERMNGRKRTNSSKWWHR